MTAQQPLPWQAASRTWFHEFGTDVDEAQSTAEAMAMAGLDWTASPRALWAEDGAELVAADKHRAIVRDDTGQVLGVVGSGYDVLQPIECFSFLDALISDGSLRYERAGCVGDGRLVWMLASYDGGTFEVAPGDEVRSYLLAKTHMDGLGSTVFGQIAKRIACSNAIRAALARAVSKVSIRHTVNQRTRMADAERVLAFGREAAEGFAALARRLAQRRVTGDEVEGFVRAVTPVKDEEDVSTRTQRVRATIRDLNTSGMGADLAAGTAWQLLNAATEYTTHVRNVRGDSSARTYGNLFHGAGADINKRALAYVTELAEA